MPTENQLNYERLARIEANVAKIDELLKVVKLPDTHTSPNKNPVQPQESQQDQAPKAN